MEADSGLSTQWLKFRRDLENVRGEVINPWNEIHGQSSWCAICTTGAPSMSAAARTVPAAEPVAQIV